MGLLKGITDEMTAYSQGLSDGRYGYIDFSGDWGGDADKAYHAGYAQGKTDRKAEPERYISDIEVE